VLKDIPLGGGGTQKGFTEEEGSKKKMDYYGRVLLKSSPLAKTSHSRENQVGGINQHPYHYGAPQKQQNFVSTSALVVKKGERTM